MEGKLIVIESGTDSSGKETQTKKLYQRLKKEKPSVRKVEYPNYDSQSSALVKMYLEGKFGGQADDVNAYAASTFFAVDRYASFKQEWQTDYQQGKIIIADRYTTSNMVHQAAKINNEAKREEYLNWLWELEFDKLGLPVPDCVIFLDVPPEKSRQLLKTREEKKAEDIHEKDKHHLNQAYETACLIAEKFNWEKIDCLQQGKLQSIEQIHQKIYTRVEEVLGL